MLACVFALENTQVIPEAQLRKGDQGRVMRVRGYPWFGPRFSAQNTMQLAEKEEKKIGRKFPRGWRDGEGLERQLFFQKTQVQFPAPTW